MSPRRKSVAQVARRLGRGEVAPARDGETLVAVVRLRDGRLRVIEDRCPHDGGILSDGYVDGDVVVCARHGWEIDPCTRQCEREPLRLTPWSGNPLS